MAMLLLGSEQNVMVKPEVESTPKPEQEQESKFSYQVAWVVAVPSKNGHIVNLSCSQRQETMLSQDTEKIKFQNKIFEGMYIFYVQNDKLIFIFFVQFATSLTLALRFQWHISI